VLAALKERRRVELTVEWRENVAAVVMELNLVDH